MWKEQGGYLCLVEKSPVRVACPFPGELRQRGLTKEPLAFWLLVSCPVVAGCSAIGDEDIRTCFLSVQSRRLDVPVWAGALSGATSASLSTSPWVSRAGPKSKWAESGSRSLHRRSPFAAPLEVPLRPCCRPGARRRGRHPQKNVRLFICVLPMYPHAHVIHYAGA